MDLDFLLEVLVAVRLAVDRAKVDFLADVVFLADVDCLLDVFRAAARFFAAGFAAEVPAGVCFAGVRRELF